MTLLTRLALLALLMAPAQSLALDGQVDERSLEFDASGTPVRASGEILFGAVPVGRFVLKLPRGDEPTERGTVSIHLEQVFDQRQLLLPVQRQLELPVAIA